MTSPLSKISESTDSTLYEKDYYLWLTNTANLLREKNLAELDLPHLIEEIEDMGLSLIHISEPTRPSKSSRMPSSA